MTRTLLARGRLACLLATAALTVVLGLRAVHVGIEHDNESLNAQDPVRQRVYADFKAIFGNDEDLLLTLTHPRLLEPEGLRLVDALTRTIAGWDGVRRVWSPVTVEELVPGETGAEPRPLLAPPWNVPEAAARARLAFERNPDFTGWIVSPDRRTAGFVVQLEERPGDDTYRARLIAELRGLATRYAGGDVSLHLTGVPVQKHDVSAYVDRDQRLLLPLAIVVLGVTLAAFFRDWSGVAVPLGVAAATVIWTIGAYAWSGHALNAITSLLPAVLLVVALAASVHVYQAWHAGHGPPGAGGPALPAGRTDGGVDRIERALRAMLAVAVPATLCAVTTAQGFLSLAVSEIPAVRQFGLFAALGVAVAFLVGMTAVPAVLSFLPPPPGAPREEHRFTLRLLDTTSRLATTRPWLVLAVFSAITAVAAAGIPLIRANTDLVGFLRADAPLRRDTAFVDGAFGGTLPLDFVLRRRDGRPLDSLDGARRLAALEDSIRAQPGVATVTSVLALVRQVHRAETRGTTLALPGDERQLRAAFDLLDASGHDLVRRFAAPDLRTLRLAVRLRSAGTAESARLVAAIRHDARRILGREYALVPTGALYHVIHDSSRLVREQVTSFATAIVLVVLAIGLLLRSLSLTMVALVPNVMPIVWTGGLMGWAGIELSTGTAMIASAVLGLVVDDTIHYLSYYRRVYAGDAVTAIQRTTRAVGAPVTVASVSLILGFWVGAFGSFAPTVHFSLLTGLTMITGVVCDLLVLPAALVLLDRRQRAGRPSALGLAGPLLVAAGLASTTVGVAVVLRPADPASRLPPRSVVRVHHDRPPVHDPGRRHVHHRGGPVCDRRGRIHDGRRGVEDRRRGVDDGRRPSLPDEEPEPGQRQREAEVGCRRARGQEHHERTRQEPSPHRTKTSARTEHGGRREVTTRGPTNLASAPAGAIGASACRRSSPPTTVSQSSTCSPATRAPSTSRAGTSCRHSSRRTA